MVTTPSGTGFFFLNPDMPLGAGGTLLDAYAIYNPATYNPTTGAFDNSSVTYAPGPLLGSDVYISCTVSVSVTVIST